MKSKLISFIINSPKKAFLLGLLISIISTVGILQLQADFSYRGYYYPNNPLLKAYDDFEKSFSGDDNVAIIIDSKTDLFTKDKIQLIHDLTKKMWNAPHVMKVTSLTNYVQTKADGDDVLIEDFIYDDEELTKEYLITKKQEAREDKTLQNYLISEDHKVAVLVAKLRPSFNKKINYKETIDFLENEIKDYNGKDYKIIMSGNSLITITFAAVSTKDLMLIIPLCLLMIAIIIFFFYRSIHPIYIVFVVMGLSVSSTLGLAGFVGIKYSNILGAIPVILMAIGIADCVHFFSLYYKELKKGLEVHKAAAVTLEHIIFPTFLTSFSTALGFISLAPSQVLPIAGLGVLGAFGAILAWLLTLFICVPLSMLFIKDAKKTSESYFNISHEKIERFIESLYKIRYFIIAFFIALTVSALYMAKFNKVDSDPLSYLTNDVPFKQAALFVDDRVGGFYGIDIVIDSGVKDGINDPIFAKKVDQFTQWLEKMDKVTKVVSYIDIIKKVHKALNQGKEEFYTVPDTREKVGQMLFLYDLSIPEGNSISDQITVDKKKVRVTGMWTKHASAEILKEADRVDAKLKELGLNGYVAGKMRIYHNMNNYVVSDFISSIGSAVIVIAILMIIIFRSIPLGLLSMLPNILPIILGAGTLYLLGKNFDMGTVIVGAICLGIAVDDTIHFLSTYALMRKKGLEIKKALVETLHYVGVPLMTTTLILVCGFGVFVLGKFVPNSTLGLMTSIVLIFALALDLILLPTLLLMGAKDK
jgi:predicted RND superfamily exporter protein